MPPTPRKTVPPRKTTPRKTTPPVAGNDDFTAWQENQPVVEVTETPEDYFPGDTPTNVPAAEPFEEKAPRVNKPLGERMRAAITRAREDRKQPTRGRPRTVKPRVSVDKVISDGWGILSGIVNNVNPPVARVLAMQSPVAGLVLEDRVKNSALDRLLQPLARNAEAGETMMALLGPPLIVAALTTPRGMAMRAQLEPMLRMSLRSWITIAGPSIEKVLKEEAEFEEKYGMQIDAMIHFIITGEQPTEPSPNGTHATVPGDYTVSPGN